MQQKSLFIVRNINCPTNIFVQMESEMVQILTEQNLSTYDLVIVGAGCVGTALAYITSRMWLQNKQHKNRKICLIQRQKINSPDRYWSSSFSARQNRIQYNQQYLVQYVQKSNEFWEFLQKQAGQTFNHKEGALWFGDKDATTSEGSISQSNRVLQRMNVKRLYMKNLIPSQPKFLRNFKIQQMRRQRQGHCWEALYSDQGGSIDMKKSYNYFLAQIKKAPNVLIKENVDITEYRKINGLHNFKFKKSNTNECSCITGVKVFIAAGIYTPEFIEKMMKGGSQLKQEAKIQEYVASYFKIKEGFEDQFDSKKCPNFYNFLDPLTYNYEAGYGFPFHEWDQPVEKTIKIGTLSHRVIRDTSEIPKQLTIPPTPTLQKIYNQDKRVLDNEHYVQTCLNGLEQYASKNYICPMIFYEGRETILDYLNRKDKSIVVQSGGWIGKYYPYLAKTAFYLLFPQFDRTKNVSEQISEKPSEFIRYTFDLKQQEQRVIENFLQRSRYPIRKYVDRILQNPQNKLVEGMEFDTLIVGGGCSGLYSAYRLNEEKNVRNLNNTKKYKIGVFEMLGRISGRLWSVSFQGSKTPMELGGMRYIENEHLLLVNMIKKLQIPSIPFNMKGDYLQSEALKAYIRGCRYAKNQWDKHHQAGQKFFTDYKLEEPLIGMNAVQIFSYSIYLILNEEYNQQSRNTLNQMHPQVPDYFTSRVRAVSRNKWTEYQVQLTLQDWNAIKNILKYRPKSHRKGVNAMKPEFIFKFGFQNIIEDQFSHQTYQFVSSQNGYFSLTSNESYIEHIVGFLLDFGLVQYKTLSGGFDMFNYSLANNLLDEETGIPATGGGIYIKQELMNIQKKGQKYVLTFKSSENQKETKVVAYRVILAMPRRSIERLYEKITLLRKPISYPQETSIAPLKPKNLLELVNAVKSMPSIKIIMNFKTNWWDISKRYPQLSTGFQMRGVSITDLPIRQTLYFGTDTDHMLLASYNDKQTTQFWTTLQNGFEEFQPTDEFPLEGSNPRFTGKPKRFRLNHEKKENIAPASYQVVHQVLRQLRLLHGQIDGIDQSNVKQAMFQSWQQDPFGGGYHFWKAGYNIKEVMQTVRAPWTGEKAKENIYVISSAYSNTTAWAEGALQMVERLLADHFGLSEYLPNYYKGW